jgi:hypothetical protein
MLYSYKLFVTYIFEQLQEISSFSDTFYQLCVGAAMIDCIDEAVHLLALLVDLILKQCDDIVLVIHPLF